jgi:hypothetical protein
MVRALRQWRLRFSAPLVADAPPVSKIRCPASIAVRGELGLGHVDRGLDHRLVPGSRGRREVEALRGDARGHGRQIQLVEAAQIDSGRSGSSSRAPPGCPRRC